MKKRRNRKAAVIAATTTPKNWGFGPVSGKGGNTKNSEISESMFRRELKEMGKN